MVLKYDTVTLVVDNEIAGVVRYFGRNSLKKIMDDLIENNHLTEGVDDFYFFLTLQSKMNKEDG